MSLATKIQWAQASWNPVVGCSRVSEGCRHCYAERQAGRVEAMGHRSYAGLTKRVGGESRWTGVVRLLPEKLAEPLRRKNPTRYFVNSMSDLFHEGLADEDIDRVFATMALAPQHTFLVLTKRAERMRSYFDALYLRARIARAAVKIDGGECGDITFDCVVFGPWPLRNLWLGVSAEDQATADERIPLLLDTPAAVRWVSAEPLLSRLGVARWLRCRGTCRTDESCECRCPRLNWLVVGGESGPGARPCDVAWVRSIVEQCREASVPCFVKQLGASVLGLRCACGAWPERTWRYGIDLAHEGDCDDAHALPCGPVTDGPHRLSDPKGGDPSEWPADLRVREYPS